jgi:hypothetical protein
MMPPLTNSTIRMSRGPNTIFQFSARCALVSSARKKLTACRISGRNSSRMQRAEPAEHHHEDQLARALPRHEGRADELRLIGQEATGETRHHAADHIGGELKSEGLEPDGFHARGVFPRAAQDSPEAGHHERPGEGIGPNQEQQADPVEGEVILQDGGSGKEAARRQGHAIVAAIGGKRCGQEVQHLPEGEGDHDEVDALRPKRNGARDQPEERGGGKSDRDLEENVLEAVTCQDADRIAAEPEESRVAEAHESAVAEDEIERHGGNAEDHDPCEEGQDIAFRAGERGEQWGGREGNEEHNGNGLKSFAEARGRGGGGLCEFGHDRLLNVSRGTNRRGGRTARLP